MKILIQNQEKQWISAGKIIYKDEAELQNLLVKDVNTLPFDEIGYDSPFVTIGKEITLQNGSLDILAVNPEGQIALIETKLNKNPEAKRTVVGQILGYASYLWDKSYQDIEDCFDKLKATEKIDFSGSLVDYVKKNTADANFSEADFKIGIEKGLRLGTFTLLIVVDEVNEELKNIANYLNERTGQGIDFYLVSMELMSNEDRKLLIPRLINPPHKNIAVFSSRSGDNYNREPITKEEFLRKLSISGKRLAESLFEEFENYPNVKIVRRKSGLTWMTSVPKKYIKPGYLSNFSYLFFKVGNDPDKNELEFDFADWAFENMKEITAQTEEYVNFYRSINNYDKLKKNIKDLSVFDDEKIQQLIELIKKTAENLQKQ